MRSLWIGWLLLCLASAPVRADEVEVVQLRHRTAEQLIPVLQPLLDPDGALSGMIAAYRSRSPATTCASA